MYQNYWLFIKELDGINSNSSTRLTCNIKLLSSTSNSNQINGSKLKINEYIFHLIKMKYIILSLPQSHPRKKNESEGASCVSTESRTRRLSHSYIRLKIGGQKFLGEGPRPNSKFLYFNSLYQWNFRAKIVLKLPDIKVIM